MPLNTDFNYINCKKIAKDILTQVQENVRELNERKVYPKLIVFVTEGNKGSLIYANQIERRCKGVGVICEKRFIKESELIIEVLKSNKNPYIHGIVIMLPLRDKEIEANLRYMIAPNKDVDGLSILNMGRLMSGHGGLKQATAKAVLKILDAERVELSGKRAIVIGRSLTVGKPVAELLTQRDATVTLCHSKTQELAHITSKADIVVSAIGQGNFIDSNFLKWGATVIDCGIQVKNGKILGDIDINSLSHSCYRLTSVPNGVGEVTLACLLENLIEAIE